MSSLGKISAHIRIEILNITTHGFPFKNDDGLSSPAIMYLYTMYMKHGINSLPSVMSTNVPAETLRAS